MEYWSGRLLQLFVLLPPLSIAFSFRGKQIIILFGNPVSKNIGAGGGSLVNIRMRQPSSEKKYARRKEIPHAENCPHGIEWTV